VASLISDQAQARNSDQPTDKSSADADIATRWQQEIARYDKWSEDWRKRCEKILKIYARQKMASAKKRKFAMLWANTEVLKPSVYSRAPIPQISRRYKDKDSIGRVASELLERSVTVALDMADFDARLKHVRDDLLLPGRGTVWVRVDADTDTPKIAVDYVHWRDFGHTPGRVWEEVSAVWRWSYLSKEQLEERFPDKADDIPLDHKDASDTQIAQTDDSSRGVEPKAAIAEIWDKTTNKVYFISKGHPEPLEVLDPFISLTDFWPCPRPIFATLTNENLIPTPDYTYYRDQAEEIDQLTARIDSLSDMLKLVIFYPAGKDADVQQAFEKAFNPNTENVAVPVESWAAFVEGGGAKTAVWLPIADTVATIEACVSLRTQLINDVYQISGISDVLRGSTDPQETATAQTLKAQWGSIRIRDRQQEIARFARDVVRIASEIMAEHFDFDQLRSMANMAAAPVQPTLPSPSGQVISFPQSSALAQPGAIPGQGIAPQSPMPMDTSAQAPMASGMPPQPQGQPQPPQQQSEQDWDEADMPAVAELLKSDQLRSFRIDIETDSTIQPDEDAEKQRRVEFLEAVATFMQQAVPALQILPAAAPMLGEMLLFLVRGFRAGRTLEDVIERAVAQMSQAGSLSPPTPPDPTTMKVQAEQPLRDAELQLKQGDIQLKSIDAQIKQAQLDAQMRDQTGVVDNGELGLKQQELSLQAQQQGNEEQRKQRELALQEAQHAHAVWQSQQDLGLRHRELALKERQHASAEKDGEFNRNIQANESALKERQHQASEVSAEHDRKLRTKEVAMAGRPE
jgi:hypothetical protein